MLVTDGIILRRAEYKDFDRMITLFSPTHGCLEAIARGCRRPKSSLMNTTELFCSGEYTLRENRGRYSVVHCRVKDSFHALRFDLDKLTHGSYYLSLADAAALPGEAAPEVFMLTIKALTFLTYSDLPPALLTMAFETRYMPLMGYLPRMDSCVTCGALVEGAGRFDAERGGAVCLNCHSSAPKMTEGVRRIILRAAQTDYNLVGKLLRHPDWQAVARLYRPFVLMRIDRNLNKVLPELP